MEDVIMAKRKVPFTKKFDDFETACEYVRKHIAKYGYVFEQKCIYTGAGCHVDNRNNVTIIGYSW
jgi:hypothetical protein